MLMCIYAASSLTFCYMHRRHFIQSATGSIALLSLSGIATASEVSNSSTPVATTESSPPSSDPQTHTVRMFDSMIYDPEVITISPGDTVKWINVGAMGHSVTAYEDKIPAESPYWASGDFESENDARGDYPIGNIAKDESYSHTFDSEGEHEYFCIPHESIQMVGKVVVKEGGAQAIGASGSSTESSGEKGEDPEHMGVPFQAHWVGLATILGIFVSLVFTFFFLKYNETPHSGYPKQK
jgi:plastocyanin